MPSDIIAALDGLFICLLVPKYKIALPLYPGANMDILVVPPVSRTLSPTVNKSVGELVPMPTLPCLSITNLLLSVFVAEEDGEFDSSDTPKANLMSLFTYAPLPNATPTAFSLKFDHSIVLE